MKREYFFNCQYIYSCFIVLYLNRLKEVHLNMTVDSSNEHLTQFISKLSNLEHLNVEICGYGLVEGSNALLDFIFTHKSCQNLKVLRFTGPVRVMWRRAFFDLLCKSSLRKLLLDCTHIDFIGSENLPITKNNNLKVLQLSERFPESRQHYNSLMILFIRACSGLEKLELAAVTCEIMDAVNQYQVRSATNVVKNVVNYFSFGICQN